MHDEERGGPRLSLPFGEPHTVRQILKRWDIRDQPPACRKLLATFLKKPLSLSRRADPLETGSGKVTSIPTSCSTLLKTISGSSPPYCSRTCFPDKATIYSFKGSPAVQIEQRALFSRNNCFGSFSVSAAGARSPCIVQSYNSKSYSKPTPSATPSKFLLIIKFCTPETWSIHYSPGESCPLAIVVA